jgi:hypothetical protein
VHSPTHHQGFSNSTKSAARGSVVAKPLHDKQNKTKQIKQPFLIDRFKTRNQQQLLTKSNTNSRLVT